jgi:hypothetical protein
MIISMSSKEISEYRADILSGRLAPLIVMCIAYRSSVDHDPHHTPEVISMIFSSAEGPAQSLTGKAYHISTDRVGDAD